MYFAFVTRFLYYKSQYLSYIKYLFIHFFKNILEKLPKTPSPLLIKCGKYLGHQKNNYKDWKSRLIYVYPSVWKKQKKFENSKVQIKYNKLWHLHVAIASNKSIIPQTLCVWEHNCMYTCVCYVVFVCCVHA